MLRNLLKYLWFFRIKRWTPHQYRLYHLRKVGMKIGKNCWLFSEDLETNEPYLITIGDNVIISAHVLLLTHDASASYYIPGASDIFGRVNIGNNVFIGAGAIILPGVTIADNCIIGAGSIVTKSFLKQGGVITGNPAHRVCSVEELYEKNKWMNLNVWNVEDRKTYLLQNEELFKVAPRGD